MNTLIIADLLIGKFPIINKKKMYLCKRIVLKSIKDNVT